MEGFVELGYGSGRSGVVRFGKVSRGLVGRVLVWQLRHVWASSGKFGFVKVGYGSHGTEVVRSDWSRSVKVGSVMVGQVRSLAWQVISQINRKGNQRNGSF